VHDIGDGSKSTFIPLADGDGPRIEIDPLAASHVDGAADFFVLVARRIAKPLTSDLRSMGCRSGAGFVGSGGAAELIRKAEVGSLRNNTSALAGALI
jgi:hypothetical protein